MTEIILPGGLGRRVNHDPRSRAFAVADVLEPTPIRNIFHRRYGEVLDQGNLGSCTGNAAAQAMNHKPLRKVGRFFNESDAVSIYSRATQIDPFTGTYPPEDTGSDGTSVARVLKERALISEFRHVFHGSQEVIAVLQSRPLIFGVSFYSGMLNVDDMEPLGDLLGGHEMVINGWQKGWGFRILNSWGSSWGHGGYGRMTESSLDWLLSDGGDATVLF